MRAGPARLEMLVRTLRPIDVVALASFQRRAGGMEITAHNWPRIEPESGRVPFVNLLTSSFAHRPGGQRGWVAQEDGRLVGLSAARPNGVRDVIRRLGIGVEVDDHPGPFGRQS